MYTHDNDHGSVRDLAARIIHDLAARLRNDVELLGLDGRTELVKAALELLHRRAADERMARNVAASGSGRLLVHGLPRSCA